MISKEDLSLISGGKGHTLSVSSSNALNQTVTISSQIGGSEHGAGADITLSIPINDNIFLIGKTTLITDYNKVVNANTYVGIHGQINF